MRTRTFLIALSLTFALPGAFLATASPGDLFRGVPVVGDAFGDDGNETGNETDPPEDNETGGPGNETDDGGDDGWVDDILFGDDNETGNGTRPPPGGNSTGGNSTGNSTRGLHVDVDDGSGRSVAFFACQDLDGDGACGEEAEPRFYGCGTGADLPGFHRHAMVRVTVQADAASECGRGTPVTFTIAWR